MELNHDQTIELIETLIGQKKYQKAVQIGLKGLYRFPDSSKLIKLLSKAEKKYEKQKIELVNLAIKELDHLWKEKAYNQLQQGYQKLYDFCPNHKKLLKLIGKLNDQIFEEEENEYQNYLKNALTKIKQLISSRDYKKAIRASLEGLKVDGNNLKIKSLLQKARHLYVEDKLGQRKIFIQNKDFKNLERFYDKLIQVDPDHPELQKLRQSLKKKIEKANNQLIKQKIDSLVELVQKSLSQKKYTESYEICQEILRLDPQNIDGKKLLKRIALEELKTNESELLDEMIDEKKHYTDENNGDILKL